MYCTHNFIFAGFRLDAEVVMNKSVAQWINCVIECASQPCCRSINFKKEIISQDEPNCEMLHKVVYKSRDKLLKQNPSYKHVYLISPQKASSNYTKL